MVLTALTAHGGGLLEDLQHLRVHLDQDILLDGHAFVPHIHLVLDPQRELVLEDRRAHVRQPGLRRLRELERGLRQVRVHLGMVRVQVAPDFFDA